MGQINFTDFWHVRKLHMYNKWRSVKVITRNRKHRRAAAKPAARKKSIWAEFGVRQSVMQ